MRVAVLLPLLLLLAYPAAASRPLLVGVVPDLPGSMDGEEGVALGSDMDLDLTGYTLTDGESSFALPAGVRLAAGVPTWLVANGSTWGRFDGPVPAVTGFDLRLGNDGDDMCLVDPLGVPADCFAYGSGATAWMEGAIARTSPGLVYQRRMDNGTWPDTDDASDWRTPRMHRIGESSLDQPTFEVARLTAYSSPDSSFQVLTGLLAGATRRVHLHVYELRSAALVDAVVASRDGRPDVDLQVLVEAGPVGMDAGERHVQADALRRVTEAGGQAWLAGNGRYGYHHLKVLVVDDAVAIQSENWVPSGVPEDPTWGNRGWGVVVHDAAAADWFAAWMAADRAAWDTSAFDLAAYDPAFEEPARLAPREGTYRPTAARTFTGAFRVTPIVAPDHTADPATDLIARTAASARGRLLVQQLDLALAGGNGLGWQAPDALAEALAVAQASGAAVRVQLAEPFSADDDGNAQAIAHLDGLGIGARTLGAPFAALHNKGLVADDAVVLGSVNANHHSRSANREVAVLLEGPGPAAFYAGLFEGDWAGRAAGRDWSVPGQDLRSLPATLYPTLLALLLLASSSRSRT